jgi:LPXTG-site transpeptidase (sortase) family protein
MRLVIPSLSVDADVQDVGITSHNTMAVPTNFTDVGWYRYGPEPGENGSAVMAGHVDNALALPGVFKHLQDIEIGADVYVHTQNGSELHFVVDDVQTYKASDAPSDEIFDPDTEPRLNLITCEGTWIQSERQYDHRLVVYTHLVS